MEIKRTQPGQANWNRTGETGRSVKPATAAGESVIGGGAGSAPFRAICRDFKRADLSTDRWSALLHRSIDALLDSTAERMGGLPDSAREKLSALLAADPIFSKRVFVYWDKNLN
jgi:hypothetical protein